MKVVVIIKNIWDKDTTDQTEIGMRKFLETPIGVARTQEAVTRRLELRVGQDTVVVENVEQ